MASTEFWQRGLKNPQLLSGGLQFRATYDGSNNMIYFGQSMPNVAESDFEWRIVKFTYDGSSNITKSEFARKSENIASADFNFAWDQREQYNYGPA